MTMKRVLVTLVLAAVASAECGAQSAAPPVAPLPQAMSAAARASLPEFVELLALPNDAINANDIRKNIAWLEAAFRKRGFETRQLANDGKPLLFAEYPRKVAGAKTVLFYMHFDGQPVIPAQWAQKNPWAATLKQRNAKGEWEEIDLAGLFGAQVDPEWRVFARSSSDDKGPIVMFLAAFDALKATNLEPAFNVKVILDSEEEKGSVNIGKVATAHRELLRADALLIHDGPRHASEKPTIVFGNRGNTTARLTVYGPKSELHSGHFGNYVPNPAQRLAALLASMKDDTGRVTIAGYYDRVKLTDAERKVLAEVGDDEAAIRKRIGIAKPEAVGANLQEAIQYPSLNIRGMAAAAIGDKASNIIPSQAVAELDLRTTPEAPPEYLFGLIEQHVRGKGYYLAQGAPSDAERAAHDKIASFTLGRGSRAARTPLESPLGQWVDGVLRKTHGANGVDSATVRIRMMGGSVPTDKLVEALDVPFVIVPLVNGDNNQHSFDENLRLGHYFDGVRTFVGLLRTKF
mgnify:FL=1